MVLSKTTEGVIGTWKGLESEKGGGVGSPVLCQQMTAKVWPN